MLLEDFHGTTEIETVSDLLNKLRTERKDDYGAFTLIGDTNETSLSIMIHGDFAFLYFFPDSAGEHAGFEPTGMTPPNCPESVFVLQTTGERADGFDIPAQHLISLEQAYTAATEYFESQALPTSITWLEL